MNTVRQLLQLKGKFVYTIRPDDTVYEALRLMADKDIGTLPDMEEEQVIGLIAERDYARKVILHGRASQKTPVREIMVTDFRSVHPDQTVEECMEMITHGIHHLVVMEDNRLVGVISSGDIVRNIIYTQRKKLSLLGKRTLASMLM
ncbi:MAG: CBS domain-containing protein [Anaerolineaceae bacterium]|nr:CBS domain-containing protein [Anaerolineaceae bacterium]